MNLAYRTLGNDRLNFWQWLCRNLDWNQYPEFSIKIDGRPEIEIRLINGNQNPIQTQKDGFSHIATIDIIQVYIRAPTYNNNSPPLPDPIALPAYPENPQQMARNYDRVILKEGAEEKVEEMLKLVEPRLRKIRSLNAFGAPLLYVGLDGLKERIPAVRKRHAKHHVDKVLR